MEYVTIDQLKEVLAMTFELDIYFLAALVFVIILYIDLKFYIIKEELNKKTNEKDKKNG